MAPTTSAQHAAAQSEMLIAWWRDWTRFLESRRKLNALHQRRIAGATTRSDNAFDHDQAAQSVDAQERAAAIALDRIPVPRRAVFEAELNARIALYIQAATSGEAEDRAAIERTALDELTEAAYGRITSGKDANMASVPCEGRVWFTFPPATIDALPPEAAYSLAGPARGGLPQQRLLQFIVLMIVIWGGAALVYVQPWAARAPAAAAPAAALVNGAPLPAWPVRAIAIGEAELPVAVADADAWPAAPAGVAGWRAGRVWPMEICLPRGALPRPLPESVGVRGANGAMDRAYRLTAEDRSRADLRLVQCGSGELLAYGTLESTTPQPLTAIGVARMVPQLGTVTLANVRVISAGQDAAIPADRVHILVVLTTPEGVDWPQWLPILRLIDGSEARAATIQRTAGATTTITYDVPAASLAPPADALWQITSPAGSDRAAYRWLAPLHLPAP